MELEVEIHDETGTLSAEHETLVKDILKKAAKFHSVASNSEVSITLVDDEKIRKINKEYRNKDYPTDVISFALNDEVEEEVEVIGVELPNLLGDIIISVPRIHEQATAYEHSFERELAFLVVHGFLHLLGYDHETKEEEKVMFSIQEEILSAYGLTR